MANEHSEMTSINAGQAAAQDVVFIFLGNPSAYDPAPAEVERIDTHAAVVFLAGNFAYKIKRALRLPYLDFGTLEKRRAVCAHELEINRRTAPDIYLDVVPIVRRDDGSLGIGGKGIAVEWAVKMRRFDSEGLFDRLARDCKLPIDMMAPLAAEIAALHAGERARRKVDGLKIIEDVIAMIASALRKAPPLLNEKDVKSFAADMLRELRDSANLLQTRARQGYVRHCHGDLHLQNIVAVDGGPVLFDAIEFDDDIATNDILYDLAFLLMDLWHRGLTSHANAVFNAYLRHEVTGRPLGSLRGLALLPLFLATRAGVRAMVTLDRMHFTSGPAQKAAQSDLEDFFALARAFLRPHPPRLIAVGGLSGTGKSTLAAGLAPGIGAAPGALVVRSDTERKRLAGVGETVRLVGKHYSTAATARVYRSLYAKARVALAAGHSVVLDAVFARPHQRKRAEELARQAGVPFTGLWLEAPDRDLIERVEARTGDASDASASVVRRQLGYKTGEISWTHIDASGCPETVRKRALTLIG